MKFGQLIEYPNIFHIKNKLKSEIFNSKKVYKQKYFSLSWLRIQTGKLHLRI